MHALHNLTKVRFSLMELKSVSVVLKRFQKSLQAEIIEETLILHSVEFKPHKSNIR